jgi:hypothetical protein
VDLKSDTGLAGIPHESRSLDKAVIDEEEKLERVRSLAEWSLGMLADEKPLLARLIRRLPDEGAAAFEEALEEATDKLLTSGEVEFYEDDFTRVTGQGLRLVQLAGWRAVRRHSMLRQLPPVSAERRCAPVCRRPLRSSRRVRVVRRRSSSRASPRLSGDDDPDLPLAWYCAGCGVPFERTSPWQRYCNPGCSNRRRQRRFKARDRAAAGVELDERDAVRVLPRYRDRDLGVALVRAGADPLSVLGALTAEDAQAARAHLVESAGPAYELAKPRPRRGRLFEVSGYRSRPMNGHREFHNSTLWREVILPSEVDVDRARRRVGDGIDSLMRQAL